MIGSIMGGCSINALIHGGPATPHVYHIPSIINTSFNIHEEPIVMTPAQAIKAFRQSKLNYLAIGNFLVKS